MQDSWCSSKTCRNTHGHISSAGVIHMCPFQDKHTALSGSEKNKEPLNEDDKEKGG